MEHIPPEDDPLATRTLFTGNLELNITDEEIKRIFGRYGNLLDIDIKRPPPGKYFSLWEIDFRKSTILFTVSNNNVCSIKFRSKHSTVLLLCLLRNLMEQSLALFFELIYI